MFKKKRLGYYHSNFIKSHQASSFQLWLRLFNRILILIVIGGVVYFFLFSSFFNVKEIKIDGIKISSEPVIKSKLIYKGNIFLYPINKVVLAIQKSDPAIRKAKIYRGLPNTIKVEITEYQPELIWQRNNLLGLVSQEGVFFKNIKEKSQFEKLPVVQEQISGEISLGNVVAPPSFVEFVRGVKSGFFEIDNLTFDHLELGETSFNLIVKTKENIDIWLSSDEDLNRQISYLKQVMEKRRDKITKKIDVRIPRWVYVE